MQSIRSRSRRLLSLVAPILVGSLAFACDRADGESARLEGVAEVSTTKPSELATASGASAAEASPQAPPRAASGEQPGAKEEPASSQAAATKQSSVKSSGAEAIVALPQVKRLVIAQGVENREPLPFEGSVSLGEPVTAFVELAHGGSDDVRILVTFEHASGAKVGFVELDVPGESPRYRTWARTQNVKQAGEWQAVVALQNGPELARQSFTVAPSGDAGES